MGGVCVGACVAGYTDRSRGCSECQDDMVLSSYFECKSCGNASVTMLVVVGLIVILLFYYMQQISFYRKHRRKEQVIWVWMKIFFTSFYVISTALQFSFNFSELLDNVLGIQKEVQSLGTTYVEF